VFSFSNPTSPIEACLVKSNSIIDVFVDNVETSGLLDFETSCSTQPCTNIVSSDVSESKVIRFKIETTFQGSNTLTSQEITITVQDTCATVSLVPTPTTAISDTTFDFEIADGATP